MQKIIFVSTGQSGRRAKFAKRYFDEIEKLTCQFMMSVHGSGRWPSSRVPTSERLAVLELSEEDACRSDHIVLMDSEPLCAEEESKYKGKIMHWDISEKISWEEQKTEIKKRVMDLIGQVDQEIKTAYGSIQNKEGL